MPLYLAVVVEFSLCYSGWFSCVLEKNLKILQYVCFWNDSWAFIKGLGLSGRGKKGGGRAEANAGGSFQPNVKTNLEVNPKCLMWKCAVTTEESWVTRNPNICRCLGCLQDSEGRVRMQMRALVRAGLKQSDIQRHIRKHALTHSRE